MIKPLWDPAVSRVSQAIQESLKQIGIEATRDQVASELQNPPSLELGDLAFACFRLAAGAGMKPVELSQKLARELQGHSIVTAVSSAGPYVNLRLRAEVHGSFYEDYWLLPRSRRGSLALVQDAPKTMVEYSQPNTHKELHVGHMRNACLGDALVRLKKFVGIPVISSTFPGDVGAHVAKCLWYLKYHNQELVPDHGRGEWLGRLYSKAHLKLEDEKGTPSEEINRQQLTEILRELENKCGPFYELWKETRQWSIELMNQVYEWLGIHFDVWYWESEVDEPSRQYVKQLYAEGKLILSEGAIGMDLSAEKLGFCILLKSDGTGLYATKDLELARRKFEDFHIERSVYVVDMRQALHFAQVFKVLEKLGFEQAKNCYHLQYNFVELPDGPMSSRKGNIVPITALIQNMQQLIRDQYLSRYQAEWSEAEVAEVAKQVALGAIKYGMLKLDTQKKIVFDMKEWLKLDGDSGPFIQYAVARMRSVWRKLEETRGDAVFWGQWKSLSLQKSEQVAQASESKVGSAGGKTSSGDLFSSFWRSLSHPAEQALMAKILVFFQVVRQSALQEKPHLLTHYLYELAKLYHNFYHECPIMQADDENQRWGRLLLTKVCEEVLVQGLDLCGIPCPQKM
ncbi:MAG: arginine--tRNA ligase [Bdellovibrionaceae bacterium]|jgi:arginyl-tRNA synthetase|nr:arginine--tRNA ligase [Pseudobdellovibrionaceae bacterium]